MKGTIKCADCKIAVYKRDAYLKGRFHPRKYGRVTPQKRQIWLCNTCVEERGLLTDQLATI